jgi:hypothetical protein
MAEIPRPCEQPQGRASEVEFRHAGAGRHPGLAVGGKAQNLDSGLRGKTEKNKVDFKSTRMKSLGFSQG